MSISRKITKGAGGGSGGSGETYVDDVFSTYLYTGTAADQDIPNGVDLDGEGGLVWIKNRSINGSPHTLYDTEQGVGYVLSSNDGNAHQTVTGYLTQFNADGFSLGDNTTFGNCPNRSGEDYASWTFRKAPKFFDVVTYVGDGVTGREIPHNLGVAPGMIIVKCSNASADWMVWHAESPASSQGEPYMGILNSSDPINNSYNRPRAQVYEVTDANFKVLGTANNPIETNLIGNEYVAYVFAHDDSEEGMIQCGSFSPSPSGFTDVNLGWEPQWILTKSSTASGVWRIMDNMRGVTEDNANMLYPNSSGEEDQEETTSRVKFTATGFAHNCNFDGIYMAIRRPNKPAEEFEPEELFAIDPKGSVGGGQFPAHRSGFPVDMALLKNVQNTNNDPQTYTRITSESLRTNKTDPASSCPVKYFQSNDGWHTSQSVSADEISWMWRRAPGFFDVVTYEGGGGSGGYRFIDHSLTVAPEMIWLKRRDAAGDWHVDTPLYDGEGLKHLLLNNSNQGNSNGAMNTAFFNASYFGVLKGAQGDQAGGDYIAYLFASVPGISKVGSYTGNGGNQTIDCGFTNGARTVIIKRTDSSGDWYLCGIDGWLDWTIKLNTSDAKDTNTANPLSDPSGFKLSSAGGSNVNIDGAEYIYMAIA